MKYWLNVLLTLFLLCSVSCTKSGDGGFFANNNSPDSGGLFEGMFQDQTDYSSGEEVYCFRDMELEDVQNLVIGKWKVVKACGDLLGCQNPVDFYHEYAADGMFRIISPDGDSEFVIEKWRHCPLGYEVVLQKEEVSSVDRIFLHGIIDGVLHYSNGRVDSAFYSGEAVKVEE